MNKYEHKLAWGKTLDELSEDMTRIANIRNEEIDEQVRAGYDVVASPHEWFQPVGSLSCVGGAISSSDEEGYLMGIPEYYDFDDDTVCEFPSDNFATIGTGFFSSEVVKKDTIKIVGTGSCDALAMPVYAQRPDGRWVKGLVNGFNAGIVPPPSFEIKSPLVKKLCRVIKKSWNKK